MTLDYVFTNPDGNFSEAVPTAPSFGIALLLEACVSSYIYVLGNSNWYRHGSWITEAVAFSASNPRAYLETIAVVNYSTGKIAVSLDGGLTFIDKSTPEDPGDCWMDNFGDIWFLSNDTGSAFRSTDLGDTWSAALVDGANYNIQTFGFGAASEVAVLVSDFADFSRSKVGISTDNGDSFTFGAFIEETGIMGGANLLYFYQGILLIYQRNLGGGSWDVVYRLYNGSWGTPVTILGPNSDIGNQEAVAIGQTVCSVAYHGLGVTDNPLAVSYDGGDNWAQVNPPVGMIFSQAAIDRGTNDIYVLTYDSSFSTPSVYIIRDGSLILDEVPDSETSFYLVGG